MNPLLRKLENHVVLSEAERRALVEATGSVRRVAPREDLIRQGDKPTAVNVVLSGYAQRYKTLEDGRRQMLALLVPGDFCDLRNYILERTDHTLAAVTEVEVAVFAPAELEALTAAFPTIERAFWWSQLVDEAIAREWIVNVGQRSGLERTAHLFCELYWRQRSVGLTRGDACEMPFTQIELADTLGLTAVHVNRMIQELRREGLVTLRDRELTIPDLGMLEAVALFDPTYLHLSGRKPAHTDRLAQQR